MEINIKMTNTKISDKAKAISDMTVHDVDNINIEMDGVEIKNEAKFLDNLTDAQIDEVLNQLKEQVELLEKTDEEYKEIRTLFADMQKSKLSTREILKQHLPNLLTGTLSNIISNVIIQ